ncbi:hypothetical protein [Chryseobacterium gleum]|uniref:hypothetical protein n=1 Tax=Chryseobacterium gleum TaxID=250 RepID=UPI0028AD03FF|nr:hypothetical protein [Chryseobacterium gleum]
MRDQLKQLLFDRARNRAKSLGYTLTNIAEGDLRAFIENGVDRMTYSESISTVDHARALSNVEILIERMAQNAKSRDINQLDYKSFNSVRDSICPLWPFC